MIGIELVAVGYGLGAGTGYVLFRGEMRKYRKRWRESVALLENRFSGGEPAVTKENSFTKLSPRARYDVELKRLRAGMKPVDPLTNLSQEWRDAMVRMRANFGYFDEGMVRMRANFGYFDEG